MDPRHPAVLLTGLFLFALLIPGCVNPDYVPNGDIVIIKTDADGNEEWSMEIDSGESDRADILIQTTDGGYALGGSFEPVGSGDYLLRVIKLDADGTVLWDHTVPRTDKNSDSYAVQSLVEIPDGGYAAACVRGYFFKLDAAGTLEWDTVTPEMSSLIVTADGGFAGTGGRSDIPLFLLDEKGAVVVEERYPSDTTDGGVTVIQLDDGGYAIAGVKDMQYSNMTSGVLITTDGEGKEIWNRTFGRAPGDQDRMSWDIASLRENASGTIAVLSRVYTEHTEAGKEVMKVEIQDITIDREGNILEEKTFPVDQTTRLVSWTDDGGYAAVALSSTEETRRTILSEFALHLMKYSGEGELLWDVHDNSHTAHHVYSLIQVNDGGYVILTVREN